MTGTAAGSKHHFVCRRDADLDFVGDGVSTGSASAVQTVSGSDPYVFGVVTCESSKGSGRYFDGLGESGGVVQVGCGQFVVDVAQVNGGGEWVTGSDAKEDFGRQCLGLYI